MVQCGILDSRISHAHEIMTANGGKDDIGGYLGLKIYQTQKTGISVGQDTEGILADSLAMARSIVIYSFWHLQPLSAIRFHHEGAQREGIVTNKEIWSISILIRQVVRRRETNHMPISSFIQATVFEYLPNG